MSATALISFVFPALVIVAALRDTTTLTIPNWLTGLGLIAFVPAALIAHLSLGEIGLCLATGLGCLMIGMGLFAAGWAGGGDAKLLAVCGLWLGWRPVGPFLFWTALAGGVFALFLISVRRLATPFLARAPAWWQGTRKPSPTWSADRWHPAPDPARAVWWRPGSILSGRPACRPTCHPVPTSRPAGPNRGAPR